MNNIEFDEKKINWSMITGIILIIAVIIWMSTGSNIESTNPNTEKKVEELNTVQTEIFKSDFLKIENTFYGSTKYNEKNNIFPLESGTISEIFVEKGQLVSAGDAIFKVDIENLYNEITTTQKEIENIQNEITRTKLLINKGVVAKNKLEPLEEQYVRLSEKEQKLISKQDKTTVKSSISGRVGDILLTEGEFIQKNQIFTSVVNFNPIKTEVEIPQDKILKINKTNNVKILPMNGTETTGKISYIDLEANPETRAFKVEINTENQDNKIPSGISVKVIIETDTIKGHFIPLSTLVLNEAGEIGIKQVIDSTVHFTPIQIIKTNLDGAWIKEIKNEVQIITIGQGYVLDGEKVHSTVRSNNEFTN